MKKFPLFLTLILLPLLTMGCAQNLSPNVYDAHQAGLASTAVAGVIVSKRTVKIDGNTGMGGLAGVTAGAAAGSAIGGSPAANLIGAVGGALIAGVMGNAIDKSINSHQAIEYIIKLKNNSMVSVVQTREMQFAVDQRVTVIFGEKTRIIPAR